MPELPEVETIRQDLSKKILNIKINKVIVRLSRIAKPSKKEVKEYLTGNKIKKIDRRGKLMIFYFETGEKLLLVHLRMTGQLIYCKEDNIIAGGHSLPKVESCKPSKFTRVEIEFKNKSKLFFNDMRTFGYFLLIHKNELSNIVNKFGAEPLTKQFSFQYFNNLTVSRKTNIKAFLLNQAVVAGIGNIYADEILFIAGVLPTRAVNKITQAELKKIHSSIKYILTKAISFRGTTFNDYVDGDGKQGKYSKKLQVFQRNGSPCVRCGHIIKKEKVAGRGTHYCPNCQK